MCDMRGKLQRGGSTNRFRGRAAAKDDDAAAEQTEIRGVTEPTFCSVNETRGCETPLSSMRLPLHLLFQIRGPSKKFFIQKNGFEPFFSRWSLDNTHCLAAQQPHRCTPPALIMTIISDDRCVLRRCHRDDVAPAQQAAEQPL
jgi:hypothetical protein